MTRSSRGVGAPRVVAETHRVATGDAFATTVHILRLPRADYAAHVVVLDPVQPLVQWCAANGVDHAIIGGFYVRAEGTPLGDLRTAGRARPSVPFDAPWNRIRACVHCDGGVVSLRSRLELPPEPAGDMLQVGPMLVRNGVCLIDPGVDREGFSAGARQFDSDITVGRHPRAALGTSATDLIAAVCDGRTETEAGLGLTELAQTMIDLGADDAINLDGGGSASLIVSSELVNVPHEEHGMQIRGGRSVPTAIRFTPR
jgi:hypothetical protein